MGERSAALKHLSSASLLITDLGENHLAAEFDLINAFIFEEVLLRTEALKSYFKAYDYFKSNPEGDKLFYTLLGISRTSPDLGKEYLEHANKQLKILKNKRYQVLYLNTEAALLSDVQKRNDIILKSLHYLDDQFEFKKRIYIYSGIALNYQLLDQRDSAFYFLSLASEILKGNDVPPDQIFHYYIIKAYLESENDLINEAISTLDVLFHNAKDHPGILSQAYLRKSLIMK
jgi:hypothetical protein